MAQHVFSPEGDGAMSPKAWYQAVSEREGFIHDAAQAAAIEKLDELWQELLDFKQKRNRFLGRSLLSPKVPQGLYLWGGVGRGKSFLMDAFYACVPYQRKRRVHFHHFMAEVHKQLRELKDRPDPMKALAARIAETTRLLCFDEFHVSDIADAMILARLLESLFAYGVVFVMTSNYPPSGLYPNGLQRQNFLPAIAMLEREMEVVNVDSGNDYRMRELTREPLFMVPDDDAAHERMRSLFQHLAGNNELSTEPIEVLGRQIPVVQEANTVIWFDFESICGGPRAQTDYLEIARSYHTVMVSGIPKLSAAKSSEARRFTWLVDVFYDHRVKLVASSAVEPEQIYTEGTQSSEFFRTVSRLVEMQSKSYLELPHLTDPFELTPVEHIAS
jgi:cell division protein ZapE